MNLNREIAEKIFGYEITEYVSEEHPDGYYKGKIFGLKDEPISNIPILGYSTNIKHAMEVEAEMYRQGFSIIISRYYDNGDYCVEFDKSDIIVRDKALSKAICLASLEAIKG